MTPLDNTGRRILAAIATTSGHVTASDIARIAGYSAATVTQWMSNHAHRHNIACRDVRPRQYCHDSAGHAIALQQALGYKIPARHANATLHPERHTTHNYAHSSQPRAGSAAFLTMESA